MSMVGTETATQYFYVVLERSVPARFFKDRPRCKAGQCFGFNDSISKEKSDLLRNGKTAVSFAQIFADLVSYRSQTRLHILRLAEWTLNYWLAAVSKKETQSGFDWCTYFSLNISEISTWLLLAGLSFPLVYLTMFTIHLEVVVYFLGTIIVGRTSWILRWG